MNLSNKVIYVVATGCRRSRELPLFIKKLEKKRSKNLFVRDRRM